MAYQILNKKREWVKINNNYVLGSDLFGQRKAVNVNERTLTLPGTDETKDRDGDIITFGGWNFDNLNKNPVFLWAHNYESVPLARINKVIKRSRIKRHDFLMQFPTKGLNPFADMIFDLYGERMINACSIGFIPVEWETIEDKDSKDNAELNPWRTIPKRYLKKEALELSGCAIPANPNIVAEALSDRTFNGLTVAELIKAYTEGTLELKHKDDILEELHVEPFVIEDDRTIVQGAELEKSIVGGDKSITLTEEEIEQEFIEVDKERKEGKEQIVNKAGAVLNKKNLKLLGDAISNIQSVLESAKKEEPDPVKEPDKDKALTQENKDIPGAAQKKVVSDTLDTEREDNNADSDLDADDTGETVFDVILGDESNNTTEVQQEAPEKSNNGSAVQKLKEDLAILELKNRVNELKKEFEAKFK